MPPKFSLLIVAFIISVSLSSQVVINEVLPLNISGIKDEDGDYNDWLELFNPGSTDINLGNYALTDNNLYPLKWLLPELVLKPDSFLFVFASGKDRRLFQLSWKTIIWQGDEWNYFIPGSDIGTTWRTTSFDVSAWSTGISGFGYGDSDDNTTLPNGTVSVFLRKEFQVDDPDLVKAMALHMDYDDGFVAYINGIEIARANLGEFGSEITYNETTNGTDHEAQMYQGNSPDEFIVYNADSILITGTNVIAIQVHNVSNTSSDFSAIPYLSLGINNGLNTNEVPDFFTPPVNVLHTNFKIDKDGERIYLYRIDEQFIDMSDSVIVPEDISYGRQPDGGDNWYYFATPTPGYTNSSVAVTDICLDSVKFTSDAGYYPEGLILQLSSIDSNDKIYYTTDGNIPSQTSGMYTEPLIIDSNLVIKARIYRQNSLPGPVSTNTYLHRNHHQYPVVSISTNPENFWDYNDGIYVLGPNAEDASPRYGANFWQDWEKPVNVELFDVNGNRELNQGAGIKIYGAWTREFAQKSLALFARKEYGKGSFKYKFFERRPYDQFESLVLRNSGNDWDQTMFRDGLFTSFTSEMDVDCQAFQPAIIYINGQYWGIQNIREKISEHFLSSLHHVDKDGINLLQFGGEVVEGTNTDYYNILSFIESSDLQDADNYQHVLDKIDIPSYIQYHLLQTFIDNRDWPGNNVKFWNTTSPESKWRWILYDTDFGFGLYEPQGYSYNTLEYTLEPNGPAWPNPPWSTLLMRRLVTSISFRNNYINYFADQLNTTFLTQNIDAKIDLFRNFHESEIQDHLNRWGMTYGNWDYQVNRLKTFSLYRPNYVWNQIQQVFGLSSRLNIKIQVNNVEMGQVHVNSITLKDYPFNGYYFKNVPIELTALPKPGYKFTGWSDGSNSSSTSITYDMSALGIFTANFAAASESDISVVINEINYKSSDLFDTDDWIELYNNGSATIDLAGWILTDLGINPYIFPEGTILCPGNYIVVCEELKDFKTIHPSIKNSIGDLTFGLSSNGDVIRLYDSFNKLIDEVSYSSVSPWPIEANGTGATLELISPEYDNTLASNWKSYGNGGTPGKQNFNLITGINEDQKESKTVLFNCFPNPFKNSTTIEFEIKYTSHCVIDVIDVNGRVVNVLLDKKLTPNIYYQNWDGMDKSNKILSSGVYFLRLSTNTNKKILKVIKIN